jgi:hypothetical protein
MESGRIVAVPFGLVPRQRGDTQSHHDESDGRVKATRVRLPRNASLVPDITPMQRVAPTATRSPVIPKSRIVPGSAWFE